jgi:membrane protease YdiL (CAAX protease family)
MNSLLLRILTNFLLLGIAGMVLVWGWVINQLIHHRRLSLPRFTGKPREARWGLGTMILVFLVYNAVNLGVVYTYVFTTGRNHRDDLQLEHAATAEVKKGDTIKNGTPTEKLPELPAPIPAPKASSDEPLLSVTEGLFLLTLINEILIVAIPILVRLTSGTRLVDLGVLSSNWSHQILIGVGGALFVAPIVYSIQFLAVMVWTPHDHPVEDMIRNQFTPPVAYLAFLSAVVMAPIVEEILFRGLVQNWLLKLAMRQLEIPNRKSATGGSVDILLATEDPVDPLTLTEPAHGFYSAEARSRRSASQAIFLTSFFFALVHFQQWPAPIPIFVLSLAIGTVYHLTGSLLASIAMHATFNGLSTLMLFLAMAGGPEAPPVKGPLPRIGMSEVFTPAMNVDRFCTSSPDRYL